jgi:tetratricopeptide (TPR) repeat protein
MSSLNPTALRRVSLTVTLVLVLLTILTAVGCSKRAAEPPCACPGPGKALDQELMVRLASARALHHQADLYLQQGEVQTAIKTVHRILELDLDAKWPEAEEARLDARARLAKLLLGQDKEGDALAVIEQGIKGAQRESFYLSNLHSVRGEVLEHRAKRLDTAGDKPAAKQAAREAIDAFESSITINKKLQQQLPKGK